MPAQNAAKVLFASGHRKPYRPPCQTVSVDCPVCDEEIEVEIEWEEGEWFGTDRDGNRGKWIPGHYIAYEVPPCPNKCVLTKQQGWQLQEQADVRAFDYDDGED